jgi:hypothetical protein
MNEIEVEVNTGLAMPDGSPVGVINATEFATGDIAKDPQMRTLMREMSSWVEKARSYRVGPDGRRSNMFDRSVYTPPDNPYEQMRVARYALNDDDVVAAVADATEALAFFGGIKWESDEPDEADVLNQLSADLNLDDAVRKMWRDLFVNDQFVLAKLWDSQSYTVRGETDNGNKKKRRFDIWAPSRLTLLNSNRVVPVGYGPLREDRLAWQATPYEIADWADQIQQEQPVDPLMTTFFKGVYVPREDEKTELTQWGVDCDRLLEINPDWVFRHCNTRPDYQKFADLRMRAVFPLLDLKRQLIASDRASLIGAANYILLIRKGSDAQPATQAEVDNLKAGYNFLAKLPVIISDHRLEIDVIAPKLDFVLKESAYDVLNQRILYKLLETFAAPGRASTDSTSTFSDVLAASIQSRRHMIKRTLEKEICRAIVDHPKNAGKFTSKPSLVFTPRTVAIGTNQPVLQAMLALRTQREMSRDTILEYLGLDEATEAQRLEVEEKIYDDVFKTQIPFAAPGAGGAGGNAPPAGATAQPKATPNGTPEAPAVSGTRGGRPAGGGQSTQSPAATAKPKTGNANPSTPRK